MKMKPIINPLAKALSANSIMAKNWRQFPCIIWTGTCDPYARFMIGRKHYLVSRIIGAVIFGPLRREDNICHHCDTPACIQPNHFFKGTQADNRADCIAKGRQARLQLHGRAKLTVALVRKARSQYRKGRRGRGIQTLAKRYGVGLSVMARALSAQTWKGI